MLSVRQRTDETIVVGYYAVSLDPVYRIKMDGWRVWRALTRRGSIFIQVEFFSSDRTRQSVSNRPAVDMDCRCELALNA